MFVRSARHVLRVFSNNSRVLATSNCYGNASARCCRIPGTVRYTSTAGVCLFLGLLFLGFDLISAFFACVPVVAGTWALDPLTDASA